MTLEDAIHEELAESLAITSLVGARIYHAFRPQRSKLPCITFRRLSTVSVNTSLGPSGTSNALFEIDAWAARASDARSIANAVKGVLAGWSRTSDPEVGMCNLTNDADFTEWPASGEGSPEFRVTQDYSIWTTAS